MSDENNYIYNEEFIKRFWSKVDITENKSDCWVWTAGVQSKGYGSVGIGKGRTALAHRVAYEITYGEIPEGMFVLHKCDNRRCVNPNHLFLGTTQDNMDDMVEKGRQAQGEDNGRSKLTFRDVEMIRNLYARGNFSYKQLAEQFGVSYSSIRKIVSCEYWRLPLVE